MSTSSPSSPDLKLVAAEGAEHGSSTGSHHAAGSRQRGGVPVWLFAVVVVLALLIGLAYLSKRSEVTGLKTENAALQAELERASRVLGAYEGRIGEIRTGVHAIVDQAASLQALVDADPLLTLDAPSESPAAAESDESDEPR